MPDFEPPNGAAGESWRNRRPQEWQSPRPVDAHGWTGDLDARPTDPTSYGVGPLPPRRRRPLAAMLATVVLLVLAGGAGVFWLLAGDDGGPVASGPAPVPNVALPDSSATPDASVSPEPGVAAPDSSADPRFVEVGDCVRNDGPAGGTPELLISECGPQTYDVLLRVDGPTTGEKDAAAKCASVGGYTNWYFFDSELDTLDFVLCLKQR